MLTAFLSYWVQADALIGPDGISPWQHNLERIESFLESNEAEQNKFTLRPTLLWYSFFSNHHLLFTLGIISSLSLMLGFMPKLAAFFCWIFTFTVSGWRTFSQFPMGHSLAGNSISVASIFTIRYPPPSLRSNYSFKVGKDFNPSPSCKVNDRIWCGEVHLLR